MTWQLCIGVAPSSSRHQTVTLAKNNFYIALRHGIMKTARWRVRIAAALSAAVAKMAAAAARLTAASSRQAGEWRKIVASSGATNKISGGAASAAAYQRVKRAWRDAAAAGNRRGSLGLAQIKRALHAW